MRKLLTWRQVLTLAPLIGVVVGYAHYLAERVILGSGGAVPVNESIGLGVGVTIAALMALPLIAYTQFEQPYGRRPRSWRR